MAISEKCFFFLPFLYYKIEENCEISNNRYPFGLLFPNKLFDFSHPKIENYTVIRKLNTIVRRRKNNVNFQFFRISDSKIPKNGQLFGLKFRIPAVPFDFRPRSLGRHRRRHHPRCPIFPVAVKSLFLAPASSADFFTPLPISALQKFSNFLHFKIL